jgi:hypothetical protein
MSEGKVKTAKVKVHQPPAGTAGLDGQFHVYVFNPADPDADFVPGRTFETAERAVSYMRHEQERIYAEQEAEPALFDLPFLSSDPDLIDRARRDPEYHRQLVRDLTSEARSRARRR